MSGMFRDLSGQGAQSGRENTQKYLDLESPELEAELRQKETAGTLSEDDRQQLKLIDRVKGIRSKQSRGEALDETEQRDIAPFDHFKDKAKKEGIEPTKSVSSSTGVPDFTDEKVRARRMAQTNALMSGRGRKQSFLGGDYSAENLGGGSMLGGVR